MFAESFEDVEILDAAAAAESLPFASIREALAELRAGRMICEIANDDGAMACLPDLIRFCSKYGLTMVRVADLARYRILENA